MGAPGSGKQVNQKLKTYVINHGATCQAAQPFQRTA